MSAATQGRVSTAQLGSGQPIPQSIVLPVKTLKTIYQGTLVSVDSTGYALATTAALGQKVLGVSAGPGNSGTDGDVDNSAGLDGAKTVRVKQGAFWFAIDSASIAKTDVGKACYAVDDSTVSLDDGAGVRPFAGIIVGVDSLLGTASLGVCVLVGVLGTFAGAGEASGGSSATAYFARAVQVAALAAYTVVAGVLTENANGAISTADGVTLVVGDVIFLPEGIAAATKDAGPWVVTALGSASAKFVLKRPDWWATGSIIPLSQEIQIGPDGTLFKGTEWKSFAATAIKVVDTDAPVMWPRRVVQSFALVAGTKTVTNVPIRSATLTSVLMSRTIANTSTLTVGGYHPTTGGATGMTAGVLGTGQVIIEATVGAGTINNADISTLTCEITNY